MLRSFATWEELIAHVKAGSALYYVPSPAIGPCPTIARVRQTTESEPVRLWLRCPDSYRSHPYPSTIADETFMSKLYRWEAPR